MEIVDGHLIPEVEQPARCFPLCSEIASNADLRPPDSGSGDRRFDPSSPVGSLSVLRAVAIPSASHGHLFRRMVC